MSIRPQQLRRLAAWTCLFSWLLMLVGPLHHAIGHKNDHVHVAGAIVPTTEEDVHAHDPADLIARARTNWHPDADAPQPDERREESPDAKDHGFDSFAHFGAVPLVAYLPTVQLLELPDPEAKVLNRASELTWSEPHLIVFARGPPHSHV